MTVSSIFWNRVQWNHRRGSSREANPLQVTDSPVFFNKAPKIEFRVTHRDICRRTRRDLERNPGYHE